MNLLVDGLEEKTVFKTELTKQLSIDNHTEVYPVYKIRLDKLYYNDQNDRIATWISQYKADNKINSIDMKNKEEYNNIIHQFITESNPKALSKTQKNIALVGQEQPGVVLADGRIVDGNRRFTCLRNIQEETGNTQYMNAVILERDITGNAKEIKMLELYLQHGVDKPVDYDPIDRLVGIYNDIVDKKLLSITEYAKSVNLSEREIKREVDKAKLMVEFLEFIDAPKQFHLARKLNINDPLKELNTIMKQCKDEDRREDLKNVFFANLLIRPGVHTFPDSKVDAIDNLIILLLVGCANEADLDFMRDYTYMSDYLEFIFNPKSFDYRKIKISDYMWCKFINNEKYRNRILEHRNEFWNKDEEKRIVLGFGTPLENRVAYKYLFD